MHVAFQLKVPIEQATKLSDRLAILKAEHDAETEKFNKRIHSTPHSEKFNAESVRLTIRKKKLTANHLLRVVIAEGMAALANMKNDKLLAKLDADDVVRGRPRGR